VPESSTVVRIAILAPAADPAAQQATLGALRRLGGEVEVDLVRDVDACSALAEGVELDLVVLDEAPITDVVRVLARFRESGIPVIAVTGANADADALAAFRAGAADCVRAGADVSETLPVVALEQIRRFRQQREREWLARRIGELQRYNENIIQNLNSALVVVDPEGVITYANPAAGAVLRGVDAAEAASLEGESIWGWFPGDPAQTRIGATLERGIGCQGAETNIQRGMQRRLVPIGISCAPLLGDDGEQQGAVATFQDLSEIKQLREQVLQTEKMASIGALAAGVAHEINNPTGFIHANLYQMSEYVTDMELLWSSVGDLRKAVEAEDWDSVKVAAARLTSTADDVDVDYVLTDFAKAVRESQEGSERIRHIVQDLRDFARQDTGERTFADLNQCVDSTASIVWTMMKHSVVLDKEYGELPPVPCFPMQLKQVVMNLLVNAYQAIEEKLRDTSEVGRIVVATREVDSWVEIRVTDDGAGIADEDLSRIFDPFFTTKEVGAGTGLGLSTSYSIVNRHGGRIVVESERGQGTTFRVWLPLKVPVTDEGSA
jgi:PAS domain S-box-containing protein